MHIVQSPPRGQRRTMNRGLESPMVFTFTERKGRVSDFAFRLLTSPFTFGVYVAIAVAIAFLASAQTGIPAYVLVPVCFMAVTLLDPPARLMKVREHRQ